jgi:carbon-monoxide dehydrogenase large subunit
MTHGRAQRQTVTIGGSRDGTVAAYRLEIVQDAGAYPRFGAFLPALTILMAPGPYAFGRAEAVARSVVTNTTPVGAYRGAGRPEATAAVERAIDLFAAEIGMDPADVRRKNLLPKFTEPHTTAFGARVRQRRLRGGAGQGAGGGRLRRPAGGAGETARGGDVVQLGIGLSCYVEITGRRMDEGGPRENATVEVHPDGSATILTGPPRTARATSPCGRCWPATSSASR